MLIISTGTAVYAVNRPIEQVAPATQPSMEQELVDVHELNLIISDLMMALDVKQRLLSGDENVISFLDGTEIKMEVPSSVISQLDNQIDKLKGLLIQKTDEKKITWIK